MILHEISRRFLYLNKHDEPSFSWQNYVISIVVNKHITFFDFTYDIQSTEKNLDLKENVVSYPSDTPVSTQILQNYVQQGMRNMEMVEMVTNPLFCFHSKLLKNEMEGIKSLKCSPINFINNSQCLVAVVNNFGNVNFLSQNRCTYTNQLNFTETIIDIQAPFPLDRTKNIRKIKEFIHKVATSAVCWAPYLNVDNSCYFVTVQNSGDILFWSVTCGKEIRTEFCGKFQTNSEVEIESVTWIASNEKILLVCSNVVGQVIIYECSLICDKFKLIKEYIIWQHVDKMVVKYLQYCKIEENLVLLLIKNRHVVTQLLDNQLNVITQNIIPVNDHKIVSIVNLKNDYYLGTINAKLYKLNVNVKSNNLNVSLNAIDTKENLQNYELAGIGVSQNAAIFALALKDRRLLYRKENIKVDLVFFSTNNDPTYHLVKLIDNPSQSLSNCWDCVELIRCNVFKNKNIPQYDYNSLLLESESNVYKLKVYYIILVLYITLKKSKIVTLPSFPNIDVQEVQEKILVTQAVKLLNNLKIELENNKQLDNFKTECFVGAKNFLLYFCNKYKKSITNFINQKILDLFNFNAEYTCQSCDGKLKAFSCTENAEHFNMFCSVTFTPIESSNYIACEGCGMAARGELYTNEKPMCVFCDKMFIQFETII